MKRKIRQICIAILSAVSFIISLYLDYVSIDLITQQETLLSNIGFVLSLALLALSILGFMLIGEQ